MKLHQLPSLKTSTKHRIGRGIAAGQGKTAGRGTKGQKSRSGYNIPRRFEGGQTPLMQRIPRFHGVKSFVQKPESVSWRQLEAVFEDNSIITKQQLETHALISRIDRRVKIIGATVRSKHFSFEEGIVLTTRLQESLHKTAKPVAKPKSASKLKVSDKKI